MNTFRIVAALVLTFISSHILAASVTLIPVYNEQKYVRDITQLYQTVLSGNSEIPTRIDLVTARFLGKPYQLGALGEGESAQFDKSPLYRTDAFDCLTFVSTTLALVAGHNYPEFLSHLRHIQYKESRVSFYNRYHFVDLDWNFYNEQQGYIKDITHQIDPNALTAIAMEDKSAWFRKLAASSLKYFNAPNQRTIKALLMSLHNKGNNLPVAISRTSYVPVTHLYLGGSNTVINSAIFNRIPNGAIIEIVNKNHPYKAEVGTDLNVAHLGFALWKDGVLIFRHASKVHQQVVDVPLAQYLQKYYLLDNPQNVGIHVFAVLLKTR
jgi:hypothetical protein